MLIENTSNLIKQHQRVQLRNQQWADAAELINGQVLVISVDSLALYRSLDAIHDELGNGCLQAVSIPEPHHIQAIAEQSLLQEHKAGYVGLCDQQTLLITLNDVQMFANKTDALRNQNEIVRLMLGAL